MQLQKKWYIFNAHRSEVVQQLQMCVFNALIGYMLFFNAQRLIVCEMQQHTFHLFALRK
jgi:hypothetical protein